MRIDEKAFQSARNQSRCLECVPYQAGSCPPCQVHFEYCLRAAATLHHLTLPVSITNILFAIVFFQNSDVAILSDIHSFVGVVCDRYTLPEAAELVHPRNVTEWLASPHLILLDHQIPRLEPTKTFTESRRASKAPERYSSRRIRVLEVVEAPTLGRVKPPHCHTIYPHSCAPHNRQSRTARNITQKHHIACLIVYTDFFDVLDCPQSTDILSSDRESLF